MHCFARQNKIEEIPKEKDEVNKREVHERDVRTHDPDAMVVPPTRFVVVYPDLFIMKR
jgi:hypothetical protein